MSADLNAPAIEQALAGLRFGSRVHAFDSLGSTNDEAKRLAAAGAPEGVLVAAETQTAGRGRQGRRWLTPPGTSLAFSLVLRPAIAAAHAARVSMLAGVAVCEAIEAAAGMAPGLKWPNDVLLGGRKAGGILVESGLLGDELDYVVLGIGINVSEAPPPETVLFPATSVEAETGWPVARLALLQAIVARLSARYPEVAPDNPRLPADWTRRLVWQGERVIAQSPEGDYHGRMAGAAEDGALLLQLDDGEVRRIVMGEVSLRKLDRT